MQRVRHPAAFRRNHWGEGYPVKRKPRRYTMARRMGCETKAVLVLARSVTSDFHRAYVGWHLKSAMRNRIRIREARWKRSGAGRISRHMLAKKRNIARCNHRPAGCAKIRMRR